MRKQIPGAQISWLACHPANLLLKEAGEELLPEAEQIANVNHPAEIAAGAYKLNLMKYFSREGFGFRLPHRREYAGTYYNLIGYVFPFDPAEYAEQKLVRKKLKYEEESLVICAIGGTSIGKDLLELCGQSFPILRKTMPDLRMILVCGPRLSPDSLMVPNEVEETPCRHWNGLF